MKEGEVMNTFSLGNKKIVIYAAGATSTLISKSLEKMGLEVDGYIDKRANEISTMNGKPVRTLEEFVESVGNDSDSYCVIITPKNVFEHNSIAKSLRQLDINNLIYKPKEILLGSKDSDLEMIESIYDGLCSGNNLMHKSIPIIKNNANSSLNTIISNEGEFYKVWMPVELIFSNVSETNIWSDINMACHYPLVGLYNSFMDNRDLNRTDSIKDYIDYSSHGASLINVEISEAWKNNAIHTRFLIYKEMDRIHEVYPKFFIDNCPTVKFKNSNHFNIISSGKNRVAFQISKGLKRIPVKISKDDYDKWTNSCLIDEGRVTNDSIDFPLSHPKYDEINVKVPDYYKNWIFQIGRFLTRETFVISGKHDYSGTLITNLSKDNGITSTFFNELGFKVTEQINSVEIDYLIVNRSKVDPRMLENVRKAIFILDDANNDQRNDMITDAGFRYFGTLCECWTELGEFEGKCYVKNYVVE